MSLTLALYTHLELKFWCLLTVTLNLQQIIQGNSAKAFIAWSLLIDVLAEQHWIIS